MNTKELAVIQQLHKELGTLIQHKQPCQAPDKTRPGLGCENLADCYVVMAPDEEGQPKTLQPRCEFHARALQRVTLTGWQERVVEERLHLGERFEKLKDFCDTTTFNLLPETDQHALQKQLLAMRDYRNILTYRIKRFTGGYDIELPSE